MSNIASDIAEKLVAQTETEGIVFTRSDKIDNLMQVVFEQRISVEDLGNFVLENTPEDQQKKVLLYYAGELMKYLTKKVTKSKLSGFRGAPKQTQPNDQKKLSKSEQFLERREREKREKQQEKDKADGKIEKISLKEVGQQLEEEMEMQKKIDEKIKSAQTDVLEEQQKHVAAYQSAFELYAFTVNATAGKNKEVGEICELITKIGSSDITTRQIALDKMQRHPDSVLAQDALLAGLRDKNLIINILMVLQNAGEQRTIVPLINLIQEYPTQKDIIFRGPAERAIGDIVQRLNQKSKLSGTKYIYQLVTKPEFEKKLKLMMKVVGRDISNSKYRSDYFTPQCVKWLTVIAEKLYELKKKKVKVGFVNVSVQTDISKEIKEFLAALKAA